MTVIHEHGLIWKDYEEHDHVWTAVVKVAGRDMIAYALELEEGGREKTDWPLAERMMIEATVFGGPLTTIELDGAKCALMVL